uniref:Uncharacterized protein n=1 Tax=Rousettus aegyptiacus TaxID=9407 RepID=A0A7J8E8X2_ROUAE|nr:hypothetical protein HJG63_008133 [Rousettus aegyptiacus]
MFGGHLYVFLGEVSVQVICPFFNWIVWVFVVIELYEFFSEALLANILSHLDGCPFTLLIISFTEQKLFSLIYSHSFIFAFTSLAFKVKFINSSLSTTSMSLVPMFSSMQFNISGLIFKSLTHFELIFGVW